MRTSKFTPPPAAPWRHLGLENPQLFGRLAWFKSPSSHSDYLSERHKFRRSRADTRRGDMRFTLQLAATFFASAAGSIVGTLLSRPRAELAGARRAGDAVGRRGRA
jgi:hypothetical protein